MEWAEAKSRIFPVLRGTTSPTQAWTAAALDPDKALLRRRFVPFLHVLFAVDHDDHLRFLTRGDLATWGVEQAEVEAWARMNLDPTAGLTRRDDGLWALHAGDGYEASRLTLPGWLGAFHDKVEGRPIAAVAHGRSLLVGGEGQAELLQSHASAGWSRAGTPISPALYTVDDDGRVVPYVGGRPRPVALSIENAHKQLARREYERQSELLTEVYDVLLARFGLLEDPESGRLVQVTAWTEGTAPLLPLADVVVLHPTSGPSIWVPFRALLDSQPALLAVWEDLEPPRFKPSAWPTGAAWARLQGLALASEEAEEERDDR